MLSTHVQTPTSSCKRFKVTRHERRKFCKKVAWLNHYSAKNNLPQVQWNAYNILLSLIICRCTPKKRPLVPRELCYSPNVFDIFRHLLALPATAQLRGKSDSLTPCDHDITMVSGSSTPTSKNFFVAPRLERDLAHAPPEISVGCMGCWKVSSVTREPRATDQEKYIICKAFAPKRKSIVTKGQHIAVQPGKVFTRDLRMEGLNRKFWKDSLVIQPIPFRLQVCHIVLVGNSLQRAHFTWWPRHWYMIHASRLLILTTLWHFLWHLSLTR